MGRISSIHKLPENVREALNEWLRDPGLSQTETAERTNSLLEELGLEERVSRKAVNRYDQRMRAIGQRLRERREVADLWIGKLGSKPGGKVGHLVVEIIRGLAYDLSSKLEEEGLEGKHIPQVIDQVSKLALMAQRVEQASGLSVNREAKIRLSEREKAAEVAERTLSSQKGISEQTIDTIRNRILGVS